MPGTEIILKFPGIPNSKLIWTSYTDEEEEGVFLNLFGRPPQWENWGQTLSGQREPNKGRAENCLAVGGDDFLWHDVRCEARNRLPLCMF